MADINEIAIPTGIAQVFGTITPEWIDMNVVATAFTETLPIKKIKKSYKPDDKIINSEYYRSVFLNNNYKRKEDAFNIEFLFEPFLKKHLNLDKKVHFTSLDNFKKKFKITSNILDPMQQVWDKFGHSKLLCGGKMIDFFLNKSKEESNNDYDIFSIDGNCIDIRTLGDVNSLINYSHVSEISVNGHSFQFIHRDYSDPEEILYNFDIRACCICTDGNFVYWIKNCLQDIKKKKLIYNSLPDRFTNFIRVQKYIQKGYEITNADFLLASLGLVKKFLDENDTTVSVNNLKSFLDRDYIYSKEDRLQNYIPDPITPELTQDNHIAVIDEDVPF